MAGIPGIPEVRPERTPAAYLFHGEDLYPARRFLRDLRRAWAGAGNEPVQVEAFSLDRHRWREILDVAKSLPFFFSPRRILVVEGKGAGQEELSAAEADAFRDYFAAPTDRTTIVVLFEGRMRKTKPLAKAFDALPESVALVREIKPLKDKDLRPIAEDLFAGFGKRATPEAIERLLDTAGNDLGRLESEIEKIVIYVGSKTTVGEEDVSALSSEKRFLAWELSDALEQGNLERALVILHGLFAEGTAPELVLWYLTDFFRTLLTAKAGLRAQRDRKDIFREIKPRISEKFGEFYRTKFGEFFALVDRTKDADLRRWLAELERIDLRIKSTDSSPRAMLEAFLIGYAGRAGIRPLISPGRI